MARPENRSDARALSLTLPTETFNYLVLLATLGKLGRTENEVATHILVREAYAMLERGFYLPPSPFEACFISLAHSEDDIDDLIMGKGKKDAAAEAPKKPTLTGKESEEDIDNLIMGKGKDGG